MDEEVWDDGIVGERMKEYEDEDPLGVGFYVSNCKKALPKLESTIMDNASIYVDKERCNRTLLCFYSVCRGCKSLREAILDAAGINNCFAAPLSVKEFFVVIDSVEEKKAYYPLTGYISKGYYFTMEGIIDFCGIETPLEYGLGINLYRRERSRIAHEYKCSLEQRILELMQDPLMTQKRMSEVLEEEGFNACLNTVKGHLKDMGINWREYKKQMKTIEYENENPEMEFE